MIRVLLFGDFWNRQPLAYAPIRQRLAGQITFVDDPAQAQLVLFSHTQDLIRHDRQMAYLLATHPHLRAVLLSEEPFWDTCWAPDPFARFQTWTQGPAPFGYGVLNHFTSAVYDTTSVPYFLLTDPRYIAHYRPYFDRNAGFAAADWLAIWREAALDAAFVAERRDAGRHEPDYPERKVWGLSVLRSRITRHCKGDHVLRLGKGWDDAPHRIELPDWHSDKLDRLDLKCRYVSAIENTHQANYVTEKIFDAFAVGGVPLYFAHGTHHVERYVGKDSWINLDARLPLPNAPKSQPFDAKAAVGPGLANAYVATQNRLAGLFADQSRVEAELDRLSDRLLEALRRLTL